MQFCFLCLLVSEAILFKRRDLAVNSYDRLFEPTEQDKATADRKTLMQLSCLGQTRENSQLTLMKNLNKSKFDESGREQARVAESAWEFKAKRERALELSVTLGDTRSRLATAYKRKV